MEMRKWEISQILLLRVQTMKGFVHMEKEKFERLARQKEAQDQKLLKVMEMVAAPSPGNLARTPLGEKQATRDVSTTALYTYTCVGLGRHLFCSNW